MGVCRCGWASSLLGLLPFLAFVEWTDKRPYLAQPSGANVVECVEYVECVNLSVVGTSVSLAGSQSVRSVSERAPGVCHNCHGSLGCGWELWGVWGMRRVMTPIRYHRSARSVCDVGAGTCCLTGSKGAKGGVVNNTLRFYKVHEG